MTLQSVLGHKVDVLYFQDLIKTNIYDTSNKSLLVFIGHVSFMTLKCRLLCPCFITDVQRG